MPETPKRKAVAILCSDIHLSHRPPLARSAEPDWYAAMARQLKELSELSWNNYLPILCAGDVFDHWNAPAELINFACKHLPQMYAIPGQHDLPYHDYSQIKRSAYWTLVEAGRIKNIGPGEICMMDEEGELWVEGFPWNEELCGTDPENDGLKVALVHSYIWSTGKGYKGAPEEKHARNVLRQLQGFDIVVSGDNHNQFSFYDSSLGTIYNCGTFFRRRADEIDFTPAIGMLYSDGSVKQIPMDVSEDKFVDVQEAISIIEKGIDCTDFVEELTQLGTSAVDFVQAVIRFCNDNGISERIQRIIIEASERKGK